MSIIIKDDVIYITSKGEPIAVDIIGDGKIDFFIDKHPIKQLNIDKNKIDISSLSKGMFPFYITEDNEKIASGYLEIV